MARTKKQSKQEPVVPSVSWSECVSGFRNYLEEERRPLKTRQSYIGDLKALEAWYSKALAQELTDVNQVTARILRQWQDDLEGGKACALTDQGEKFAFATINRRISALGAFLKWAYYHDLIPRLIDPPKKIKGPPGEPGWLTPKEKNDLLEAVEHAPPRDRAVIVILLSTGLRIFELSALTWPDVVLSDRKGTLKIRGKGGKYRKVPVNSDCRDALKMLGWEKHRGTDRHVVVGERRGQLGTRGIQGIAERYGKKAGIEGFHAHRMRHTCARDLRLQGVSLEETAEIMGHSSVDTTRLYLKSAERDLQTAMDKISSRGDRSQSQTSRKRRS